MSSWIIDEAFYTDANAEVLRFIRRANPSAHSDVADELTRAGAGTRGLRPYCPDHARYAFVALHLQDLTIVGIAFGTSGLASPSTLVHSRRKTPERLVRWAA